MPDNLIKYKVFYGKTIIESFEKDANWTFAWQVGTPIQRFRQNFTVTKIVKYKQSNIIHIYLNLSANSI